MELIDILQLLALFVVGVIAGIINILAGGGSMLSMPTMILFGLPSPIANGTNRIAILAQNIVSVSVYLRSGIKRLKLCFSLALCALPGAILGAYVGANIDPKQFNYVLAIVMLATLIAMQVKTKPTDSNKPVSKKLLIIGHLIMPLIGFYGGFIQIGVGLILLPFLLHIVRLPLVEANIFKVFIVLVYSIFALAIYSSQIAVEWGLGIALACGNATGGYIGAHLNLKKGETIIKKVFNIVVIIIIIQLIFNR